MRVGLKLHNRSIISALDLSPCQLGYLTILAANSSCGLADTYLTKRMASQPRSTSHKHLTGNAKRFSTSYDRRRDSVRDSSEYKLPVSPTRLLCDVDLHISYQPYPRCP
jgi:hypothetical protein